MKKSPLMLIPVNIAKKLSKPLYPIAIKIPISNLDENLESAGIKMQDFEYKALVLVNVFFTWILFFILLFLLSYTFKGDSVLKSLQNGFVSSLGILVLFAYALISYPKISANKRSEQIDKSLVFAIRDLQLQVSSGVPLYNGLVNVSHAGYGTVSDEFKTVTQKIKTGTPVHVALEKMAISTKSNFLKRTVWQLVNSIKSGSSLRSALKLIVKDLTSDQKSKIKDYAHELNLWNLIYMLFAVAVPTIGAVMLIILSSFAGLGISKGSFIAFIGICFIIQYIIIGFIRARRPIVQF
ncbi:MAG: hypothetical protein MAG795_00631 [Candidatus Woesearchaeota archaeon]|nr:hypothetical protein [Candidatus Woesearchaeota archaeon]